MFCIDILFKICTMFLKLLAIFFKFNIAHRLEDKLGFFKEKDTFVVIIFVENFG